MACSLSGVDVLAIHTSALCMRRRVRACVPVDRPLDFFQKLVELTLLAADAVALLCLLLKEGQNAHTPSWSAHQTYGPPLSAGCATETSESLVVPDVAAAGAAEAAAGVGTGASATGDAVTAAAVAATKPVGRYSSRLAGAAITLTVGASRGFSARGRAAIGPDPA